MSNDDVNFPSHYTSGDIEAIDAIWSTGHGFGYCVGNALKYLLRAGKKAKDPVEDLRKAHWYLSFLLSKLTDSADPRESREKLVHEFKVTEDYESIHSELTALRRKFKGVFTTSDNGVRRITIADPNASYDEKAGALRNLGFHLIE